MTLAELLPKLGRARLPAEELEAVAADALGDYVDRADLTKEKLAELWSALSVELRNAQIRGLTAAQVNAAAGTLAPGAMTWVVVGDLSKIEQPIRDMKLGTVTVIDADGKPVR